MSDRELRSVPLRFDDGFRGAIASIPMAVLLIVGVIVRFATDAMDPLWVVASLCAALALFSLGYIVWTHHVYTRTPTQEARQVAAQQHRRGPSSLSRWVGTGDSTTWTVSGAVTSLLAAVTASVLGRGQGSLWLALLVLATAATSWAAMVYAFALRYFRLDAGGEDFEFDIRQEPEFIDFLSMSVMISSVGAMSGGVPRTRAGLGAVRTHTFLAFAFNALVVAMVVSLVTGLVAQ